VKPAAFREHHRKQVHLVKRHLCTRDSLQVSAPFCLQSLVEEGKKGLNEVAEERTGCKPMAQALNTCFAGELERGCILMKPGHHTCGVLTTCAFQTAYLMKVEETHSLMPMTLKMSRCALS